MRHIRLLLFILSTSQFWSCSEGFLENPPLTTITDETFPTTERDALLVTNAAYSNLRNWWYMGGYPLANIMSDDQTKGSEDGSNPDLQEFEVFSFGPTHAYILSWYQTLFQSVRQANIVIERVPAIPMDEDLKLRYVAEARFLRAFSYFNLVRIFGGVPSVTVVNPPRVLPRATEMEIYDEIIIPDFLHAASFLPEKSAYPVGDLGRATRGAAKAMLARVYLHVNASHVPAQMDSVAKYAMEVVNSGEYSLDPDFSHVFSFDGENGSGSIFELGALPEGGRNRGGNQYGNTQGVRGSPNWGWGFGHPTIDIINSFEEGDPRMDASIIFLGEMLDGTLIEGSNLTSDTVYNDSNEIIAIECYNQKVYADGAVTTQDSWGHNRRLIRYADILLMAAEALNELGNANQALNYLNEVRARARGNNPTVLPDIIETDRELLRQIIWDERRHELAFEDIRFFDLKRQGRMNEVLAPLGFTSGKNEVLPIPQQEIDLSEGMMIQNPNYN